MKTLTDGPADAVDLATGAATYFGRPDIARFLSRVPVSAIPWREYTLH